MKNLLSTLLTLRSVSKKPMHALQRTRLCNSLFNAGHLHNKRRPRYLARSKMHGLPLLQNGPKYISILFTAKEKIHPLRYSEFIPILFLVSSVLAGLSMIILKGSISQRVFSNQIDEKSRTARKEMLQILSRICGFSMFIYLFLHLLVFIQKNGDVRVGLDDLLIHITGDVKFTTALAMAPPTEIITGSPPPCAGSSFASTYTDSIFSESLKIRAVDNR